MRSRSVFGHDDAAAEFEDALQRPTASSAWLLVGPEGIGKATLAYRFAPTSARPCGGGDLDPVRPPTFRHPIRCSGARSRGSRSPQSAPHSPVVNDKTKRYSQWIGVDEVRRLRAFLGSTAWPTGAGASSSLIGPTNSTKTPRTRFESSRRASAANAVSLGFECRGSSALQPSGRGRGSAAFVLERRR